MEMSNNEKLTILLETMKQRYSEIQQMRDRAFQIVTWTVGVFLLLVGWIVQDTSKMTLLQKSLLSIGVCFASGATMWFIRDMEKGFKRQFQILNKTQTLLGLYQAGFFMPDESILPQSWMQRPRGGFFVYIQVLLTFTTIFVVVLIFLSGIAF